GARGAASLPPSFCGPSTRAPRMSGHGGAGRLVRRVVEQDVVQPVQPLLFPAVLQQKQAEAIKPLRLVGRGLDLAAQLVDPAGAKLELSKLAGHPREFLGIAAGLQATEKQATCLLVARVRDGGSPEKRHSRGGPSFPECESAPLD